MDQKDYFFKKIFVVGCPRSGTTLLQKLLINIPGSYSMPETYFFQLLANNYYVAPGSLPPFLKFNYPNDVNTVILKRILDFLRKDINFTISGEKESILFERAQKGALGVDYFFNKVMEFYNPDVNIYNIVIEKTPQHTFHVPFISSLFPEAIFLNIVRDPRDVFLSFNRMLLLQKKPKMTIAEFAFLWNNYLEFGNKYNIDTIRYEDLIKHPKKIINEKINKYGFEIFNLNQNSGEAILRPGPSRVCRQKVRLEVLPNNTNRYKDELKDQEIAEISNLCGQCMKHYNYDSCNARKRRFIFSMRSRIKWYIKAIIIWRNILTISVKLYLRQAVKKIKTI